MIKQLLSLCFCLGLTAACTPIGVITTVGTTAGALSLEERGLEGAQRDYSLKANIVRKWAQDDLLQVANLPVIVYDSKAMILGSVDTEDQRAKIVARTWEVEGVKEVYNEILLKEEWSLQDFAHDALIDAKLLAALTFDSDILDLNYKYETEGGTVYVIGLAQSEAELKRFMAHAKSLPYVKRVISHVSVKPRQSLYRENPNSIKVAR